jgi:aminomuconate-semialdehyde/2-hydroxymuconate-6-semialdehyde dehydrogenase
MQWQQRPVDAVVVRNEACFETKQIVFRQTAQQPRPPNTINKSSMPPINNNLNESLIPANVPAAVDTLPPSGELNKTKVIKNYIDGRFVDALDGQYLIDKAPATGDIIAYIPRSKKSDVAAAVSAALRVHQDGQWRRKSEEERACALERIADIIESRLEEFAQTESVDTGKPISTARSVDIPRVVANFRFFAAKLRSGNTTGCNTLGKDVVGYTLRRPMGVCGLITPWNLPLYLLTWKVAPALAMGNTIVAKCSELTPMTADLLAQVIDSV